MKLVLDTLHKIDIHKFIRYINVYLILNTQIQEGMKEIQGRERKKWARKKTCEIYSLDKIYILREIYCIYRQHHLDSKWFKLGIQVITTYIMHFVLFAKKIT